MSNAMLTAPCECGADSDCHPVWYEALAEERLDALMGQWHNPLVCVFVLQHPSMFKLEFADGQVQFLQLLVEKGIGAVNAVARHQRARNKGTRPTLDMSELAAYPGVSDADLPLPFALSLHHLRSDDGGFLSDGYDAYDRRMVEIAMATIDAWCK
ncbi:DUF5946 family protein [Microbacterium aurum]|nr:DUF5946 family protein [Microbacterium aurum]MBM7826994.1 hypothetical protein [Microbacterium aurum]